MGILNHFEKPRVISPFITIGPNGLCDYRYAYPIEDKEKMKLKFKKLRPEAQLPKYATKGAACFDLKAVVNKDNPCFHSLKDGVLSIPPGKRCIVPTGWAVEVPEGKELLIRPRSGLAAKHGITVLNTPGTIDFGYLDEVMVILYNTDDLPFIINTGDRIAQAVLKSVEQVEIVQIEEFDKDVLLTDRGGGLGSTGI